MSGKGAQTVGYHYLCSLLFGIGRGPNNALTHIKVGDDIAWEGSVEDDTPTGINKPDLFGGTDKEGGIQGAFRSLMGFKDQIIPGAASLYVGGGTIDPDNLMASILSASFGGPYATATLPYLKASVSDGHPEDVTEFRGRHVFWYDGLVSSMNPYIKTWQFRRWRTTAGWQNDEPWYPAKATILLKGTGDKVIRAMNPAHIVYQLATDSTWGRGLDADELDEDSFILAANAMCDEGLGLCFHWQVQSDVGSFMQKVIDHAGAVVYTDRETGLVNLKLIRDDYDPDEIPHFTLSNGLLSITEDNSSSSDEIADEIIVSGLDPINNEEILGRAQSLATRQFRGGGTTKTVKYEGLPTLGLCNRIAERDRDISAPGLRKFTVTLDRVGFRIHPGAVFKITYAPRGLNGIVLRAGTIDDGDMVNGSITVSAVQDVFALPLTAFTQPVENTYTPPSKDPVVAPAEIIETSYRDVYRRVTDADLAAITETTSHFGILAAKPTEQTTGYLIADRAEGESTWNGNGALQFFTANALLDQNISATDTTFVVRDPSEFSSPDDTYTGMAIYVGGEYMGIVSWTAETSTFVVKRGAVDTWPRPHSTDDRVWLVDDDVGLDDRVYIAGETVEAKVATKTSSGILPLADAPLLSVELVGRPFKPYPPADVQVGGESIFGGVVNADAEPEVSWVERNRITEADVPFGFYEPTVMAEAGTTYRIKTYNDADTLMGTHDGVTSPWTYLSADQATDGFVDGDLIWGRLYAVRDGVESLEQSRFLMLVSSSWLTSDGEILYADGEHIEA